MATGACGINCDVCKLNLNGTCSTCGPGTSAVAAGKLSAQQRILGAPCAILACAQMNQIEEERLPDVHDHDRRAPGFVSRVGQEQPSGAARPGALEVALDPAAAARQPCPGRCVWPGRYRNSCPGPG